mmetsp:Transcript_47911/g.96668  ORF Transcript_47911/g.96668 Transcript_47911/m.96668 type:complete len:226 (-) Transcript_47911:430-1107(-)
MLAVLTSSSGLTGTKMRLPSAWTWAPPSSGGGGCAGQLLSDSRGVLCRELLISGGPALLVLPSLAWRSELRGWPLGADLLLSMRVVAVGAVDAPARLPVPAELRLHLSADREADSVQLILPVGEGADLAQGAMAPCVAAAELLLLFEAQVWEVTGVGTAAVGCWCDLLCKCAGESLLLAGLRKVRRGQVQFLDGVRERALVALAAEAHDCEVLAHSHGPEVVLEA